MRNACKKGISQEKVPYLQSISVTAFGVRISHSVT